MTNAVTAGRQAGTSPIAPPTPQQARSTWPRMAALGVALLALAVLALAWSGAGPRLLLGAIGLFGVVRGVGLLRGARTGAVDRTAALVGAGGVWLGALAMGTALLSATASGWLFVVGVVALPALAGAATDRRPLAVGGAVLVAAAAVAVALLGGVDALLATARVVAAVTVGVLGLANLAGAVGMARIARRPPPAPAAGCGGCACGAGGCGSGG